MVSNEWELDCKNPPMVVMEKLPQSPSEMWVALAHIPYGLRSSPH